MERMSKPKFIKEIEKSEGKERAKCGRWYIRVYGELDHKPMVELESLEMVVKELHKLEEENKNLTKCNLNLQEWLDNKEKVNKSLREENEKLKKYYDREKEELMESCYGLARENDELKSDLEECECSFGFENDEVGFWKREYKRLKKWIKDHCNGYGNLFPEDEMKRQWKKADKKIKLKGMLMEEDTLQELKDIGEI